MQEIEMEKDTTLINKAFNLWQSMAEFRSRRLRLKSFAYGRQWDDTIRTSSGRIISEERLMIESGRMPITNNLIRRMIKNIVGRYHYNYHNRELKEFRDIDARGLEEFLISGCVVQRLSRRDEEMPQVVNVSPERMFMNGFTLSDASDSRFVGMLHDLSPSTVLRRFSSGSVSKANKIKESYAHRHRDIQFMSLKSEPIDFNDSGEEDKWRVIEVWELIPHEVLRCHDYKSADYYLTAYSEEEHKRLKQLNIQRNKDGEPAVRYSLDIIDVWRCSWLTPKGEVLCRQYAEEGERHPFVMKFYPLIDGETHSLVEEIIDQQKYVNRLITLLDDIISSSAKGVLLFPTEQLPAGFTWQDIRRIWSDPNGIIPYRRTSKHVSPRQISSSGNSPGATEMLKLQMQLFDEISGNTATVNGKSTAQGAEMLKTELEIENIAMLDIFTSYRDFIKHRNAALQQINNT